MSKASNLAGFVTSISPVNNLNVGVVTASSFVGNITGNATGLIGSPNVTVGVLTATRISVGSTTGTSGQVLQSTGTGVTWATTSGGISLTDSNVIGSNSTGIRSDGANGRLEVFGTGNFQVFTSPGTYVVNPGISSIRVRVIGAGGNGGNGANPPGTFPAPDTSRCGGGGGGGGYAHKVITSFTAPRSYVVTVGSAPGGTSSFGSECSATGGSNGTDAPSAVAPAPPAAGGAGGTGSGGDVNFTGATGLQGSSIGGAGGAAATQLGNASGKSVSGLPSLNLSSNIQINTPGTTSYLVTSEFRDTSISRFPFDIFNGFESANGGFFGGLGPSGLLSGFNGGGGGNGSGPPGSQSYSGGRGGYAGGGGGGNYAPPGSTGGAGGSGGIGAGGGGGGGLNGTPATGTPGSGGSGGAGIVIVEW